MRFNAAVIRAILVGGLLLFVSSLKSVEAWNHECWHNDCMLYYNDCSGNPPGAMECPIGGGGIICGQTCWICTNPYSEGCDT